MDKGLAHSGLTPSIPGEPVFVFGSNLAGRHGKGAALWARQHRGAAYGVGYGPQGNSYAIPTKDENLQTLPLSEIEKHVNAFLTFAEAAKPFLRFQLTPIGCGLAGYTREQIEPLFALAPNNVIWPPEWGARTALETGSVGTKDRNAGRSAPSKSTETNNEG